MSDRARRTLTIGAGLVVAVVGVVFLWDRLSSSSTERHIDDLIEAAYDYADVGDPGSSLVYSRQTYPACLDGELTGDDAWAGFKGSTTGSPDRGDVNPGAERAADRFDAEGWDVARFIASDVNGDDRVTDIRYVFARRGDDDVFMSFSNVTLDVVVSSGPCVPSFDFPPDRPGPAEAVDEFPS